MKRYAKKIFTLLTLLLSFSFLPINIAQASGMEMFLKGAATYLYVGSAIKEMDEDHQDELLEKYQSSTGVLKDASYNNRAKTILNRLTNNKNVKREYVVYVTPDNDINAFMALGRIMGVNKGTLDLLDDDALAYVMGHELAHGEHRDVVNGVKKQIGLSSALAMAVEDGGALANIIANVANNFIMNQMFTMQQEAAADETGFEILTAAGFNPGGAAASMAVIRDKYGDNYVEGLAKVIVPNNHPKTSERISKNIKRMKKYSYDYVDVKDNTVYVNDKEIYKPADGFGYTGEIRAYLMAGKLAKYYHNHKRGGVAELATRGNIVYLDDIGIITAQSNAEAEEIIQKLKIAMASKKSKTKKDVGVENKHRKIELLKDFEPKPLDNQIAF